MRILVSDDVSEKGVALLREHFDVDVKTNMPTEELLACIGEYDGLVTRSQTQVTKEVIDAAKNLKVIGRAGVGVDNIDIPAATARGIVVLNAPEGNTIAATHCRHGTHRCHDDGHDAPHSAGARFHSGRQMGQKEL